MKNEYLKNLINEVINESGELALADTNKLISRSSTLEDFMKTLVGKKLKGLLDATSFARLYILNKYGVGGFPDESDVQANVAELMDNITAFINFRKLDGLGKQRDAWDKEQYAKPEYKEWLKQRALAFKAYVAARDNKSPDVYELKDKYQAIASSDPTLPEYRKMMADKEKLVNQFHNTPLTLADVLPGPDDTEEDKKRWSAVEKSFNKLKNMNESKLKNLIKTLIKEVGEETGGDYPTATVQVFTGGGRQGTLLLLYKGDARTSERTSDVSFKTPTQFKYIVSGLNQKGGTQDEEDVKSVLRNLKPEELAELVKEKVIVTTSIPNEILDLTGKHIPAGEPGSTKISKHEFKEIVRESVSEVIDENKFLESFKMQSLEDFYQDEMNNMVAESITALNEIDLNKYRDMLGANFRDLNDDELMAYLQRQYMKRQATTDKALKKKLDKDPEFQRQIKIDRYKYPYIHSTTAVKIVDPSGRRFDLDKLKDAIKQRPTKILKQNEKLQHSGGGVTMFYNIGLPALKGLAVNEKTNKLVVIDTCPGAGACKVYCYAKKGGYIQYENAPISSTRLLNFLVNDPSGFKAMLEREIATAVKGAGKKNADVAIRWHDSGDMFSSDYLDMAYDVARKFPTVKFYAYTKLAGVAQGEKPNNFLMNFSAGAAKPQEKDVDFSKTKHSTVVPKPMFDDLIIKDASGKAVRDEKGRIQFSPENMALLKSKLAAKYNVSADSILSYDEMINTPESSEEGKYNVIVRPGDGDESANRKDVRGTYLLIH